MRLRVWTRITDLGDGSSSVKLFSSREKAFEGLDEEGFGEFMDVPCEIDWAVIDLSEGYEEVL